MSILLFQADAARLPIADASVDLMIGSSPYTDRRDYPGAPAGAKMSYKTDEWIKWMLICTREGLRISRGPVILVINGKVEDGQYHPAVEGLIYEGWKAGLNCEHPLIWSKNATPNRKDWWCNGWEFIVAFYPDRWDHKFNWQAVATPQKFKSGGGFRMKGVDGERKIQIAKPRNELARPYDVVNAPVEDDQWIAHDMIRAVVGGGRMGHPLAHKTDAPYPESLIEPIILALTDPGDIICDPFSGSATTMAVAKRHDRSGLGGDLRFNQCELGRLRLFGFSATKNPAEAGPKNEQLGMF